jgi:hypothetical protein
MFSAAQRRSRSQISDIGVSYLAHGCPLFTTLNLNGCDLIKDMGVSALGQGCPLTTIINLYCCHSVADAGISSLRRAPASPLSTLTAALGSDVGVSAVGQGSPRFETVLLDD